MIHLTIPDWKQQLETLPGNLYSQIVEESGCTWEKYTLDTFDMIEYLMAYIKNMEDGIKIMEIKVTSE